MRKCFVVVVQHISASPQIWPALDSQCWVILLYSNQALHSKQLRIQSFTRKTLIRKVKAWESKLYKSTLKLFILFGGQRSRMKRNQCTQIKSTPVLSWSFGSLILKIWMWHWWPGCYSYFSVKDLAVLYVLLLLLCFSCFRFHVGNI